MLQTVAVLLLLFLSISITFTSDRKVCCPSERTNFVPKVHHAMT